MQDRVSLHPGRVKLVPVAGQENTYDMVRADSPTQEGTPLHKDSLLEILGKFMFIEITFTEAQRSMERETLAQDV